MAQWQIEFRDFPVADMPAIPEGWTDSSWRNDACPSFFAMEQGPSGDYAARYNTCRVWIAESDPALREFPHSTRFMVTFEGVADAHDGLLTDEWKTVLAYVLIRQELAARYVATVGYNPFLDDPTISPDDVEQTLAEMESGK